MQTSLCPSGRACQTPQSVHLLPLSERSPNRDLLPSYVRTTSRSRPTKYHTHIRCFLLSESQISRITPTQKSVTSGNPPSKQIWFIAIPTAVLALLRCPPATEYPFSAQNPQHFHSRYEMKQRYHFPSPWQLSDRLWLFPFHSSVIKLHPDCYRVRHHQVVFLSLYRSLQWRGYNHLYGRK